MVLINLARFITLLPVKPTTIILHPLIVLINPLVILVVSTRGPRLQAVILWGEGIRTWLLLGNRALIFLPKKKAMRVHPLALVTWSRAPLVLDITRLKTPPNRLRLKITGEGHPVLHLANAIQRIPGAILWLKLLNLGQRKVLSTRWVWLVWKPKKNIMLPLCMCRLPLQVKTLGPRNLLALFPVQYRLIHLVGE